MKSVIHIVTWSVSHYKMWLRSNVFLKKIKKNKNKPMQYMPDVYF